MSTFRSQPVPQASVNMPEASKNVDVGIIGGGLAGLTLALQLKQADPGLSIEILERNEFPAPEAAHKVGESTVEIGSHYLSHTLSLQSLLERTQLRKFGLRFFFGAGHHDDLSMADELGASSFLPTVSYQLDRGRLENDLCRTLADHGVEILDGCTVRNVEVNDRTGPSALHWTGNGKRGKLSCRWLIDAASRSSPIKRHLGLGHKSRHRASAAWLRLDTKLDVEDWSNSVDWLRRCSGIPRMFSTNHLLGTGYWAWIIPLVDDRVSIGLVADPREHPLETFNSFEKIGLWMSQHQPLLARHLEAAADELLDFRYLKNFSHGSEGNFSNNGWALTGEAGVFADPFYSPGTDFIAISNSFICDLVLHGDDDPMQGIRAAVYDKVYQSFFQSTMSLYEEQYRGFGDTRLMVLKATWDYAYYWSVLAWLFFRELLTDIAFLRSAEASLNAARTLNFAMQSAFRGRAAQGILSPGKGRFFDQRAIPILLDLNTALLEPPADPWAELRQNCQRLEELAPMVLALLNGESPASKAREKALLGDLRSRFD